MNKLLASPSTSPSPEPAAALTRRPFSQRIMPAQLRKRLVAMLTIVLAVCACVSAWYQQWQAAGTQLDDVVADSLDIARAYAESAAMVSRGQAKLDWKPDVNTAVATEGIIAIRAIDRMRHIVADGLDVNEEDPWKNSVLLTRLGNEPHVLVASASGLRLGPFNLEKPVRVDVAYPIGRPAIGWVLLAHNTKAVQRAGNNALAATLITGVFSVGACVFVLILIIRRPLRELDDATQFVSGLSKHFG